MKKAKSIGLGLLGLSVLGLWIEGGRLVNPDTLWHSLRASLSKSTGLEWHARQVEMTLFPRPAIAIYNLEGSIPGSIPVLNAERTYAKLSLMTLLGYSVNMPSLTFDGAIIAYDGHPLHIRLGTPANEKPASEGGTDFTHKNTPPSDPPESFAHSAFFTHSKISIGKITLRNSVLKWKNVSLRPGDPLTSGILPVKNLHLDNLGSSHPSFAIEAMDPAGKRTSWKAEGNSGAWSDIPDLLLSHVAPGKRPPWPFSLKFTFPHRQTGQIAAKEDFLSINGTFPFLGDGGQSGLALRGDLQSLSELKRVYPSLNVPAVRNISGQAAFRIVRGDEKTHLMLSAADIGVEQARISLLSDIAEHLSQDAGEAVRKTASSAPLKNIHLSHLQFHLEEGQPALQMDAQTEGRGGSWQLHLAMPAGLFSTIPMTSENLYELSLTPGVLKTNQTQDLSGKEKNQDKDAPSGFHLSGTVSPTEISGNLSGVSPVLPIVPLGGGWSLADDVGRELSILHGVSMSGDFHFTRGSGDKKWNASIHNGVFSSDELSFQTELAAGPSNGREAWQVGGNLDISQAHLISGNLPALKKKSLSEPTAKAPATPAQADPETVQAMEAARESALSNASATSADLRLTAKDLSIDDVVYHDLQAQLLSQNDRTYFEIKKGSAANQELSGNFQIEKQNGDYHFGLIARPVILPSQLLFELFGAQPVLTGASQFVGGLEGKGHDLRGILASLSGKIGVSTVDSSLKRQVLIDLAGPLKTIFKLSNKDIPLRCAAASASFNNGRGDISAFGFEGQHLSLTGEGWISPLNQSLSLRLNPQMSYAGQIVNSPVEVSGEFGDLKMIALRASGGPLGLQVGDGNNGADNCGSLLNAARMGVSGPDPKPLEEGNKGEKIAGGILRILGL